MNYQDILIVVGISCVVSIAVAFCYNIVEAMLEQRKKDLIELDRLMRASRLLALSKHFGRMASEEEHANPDLSIRYLRARYRLMREIQKILAKRNDS